MSRAFLLAILVFSAPLLSAQTPTEPERPEAKSYIIDDIGQFVPTAMGLGLNVFTGSARHDWKERLALTVTSAAICEGSVFILKHTIHSTRPDGTDRHSFPSGHAARAFRGAEMVRSEFGWGWGAGAYAIAAGVGALRIHHHRHLFVDVAAGAAIGFLSTRVAYILLPLERKLFGWDKESIHAVAVPAFSADTRSIGITAALTF